MADGPRIKREKKTVDAMIHLYCRKHHGTNDKLCAEYTDLHEYAMLRLSKCPFQENKSTCGKCLIPCYKADMKTKITRSCDTLDQECYYIIQFLRCIMSLMAEKNPSL